MDIICRLKINAFINNIYIRYKSQFHFSKTNLIIQLKETITKLETRLNNESRKAEDLQVSIEEANFCGDELSVTISTKLKQLNNFSLIQKTFRLKHKSTRSG